jgi:hypothetical protein
MHELGHSIVASSNGYKLNKITLDDGDSKEEESNIGNYKVIVQEVNDKVSANIYGANINKMLRVSSVNRILEILLKEKMNNSSDNISKYRLSYEDSKYKIIDVKTKYIDIERL